MKKLNQFFILALAAASLSSCMVGRYMCNYVLVDMPDGKNIEREFSIVFSGSELLNFFKELAEHIQNIRRVDFVDASAYNHGIGNREKT